MYFSQFGEDKFIVEKELLPKRGFFLDVGAGDPIENSNTYYFEKNGWDGLCVDADPNQVRKFKLERRCRIFQGAIMDYNGTVKIDFHPSGALSRVSENGETQIKCYRLDTLLQKHKVKKIDLMSLDVEGKEIEALESMRGFHYRYWPEVIIVEYTSAVDGNRSAEILDFFFDRPYKVVKITNSNIIFKKIK